MTIGYDDKSKYNGDSHVDVVDEFSNLRRTVTMHILTLTLLRIPSPSLIL